VSWGPNDLHNEPYAKLLRASSVAQRNEGGSYTASQTKRAAEAAPSFPVGGSTTLGALHPSSEVTLVRLTRGDRLGPRAFASRDYSPARYVVMGRSIFPSVFRNPI
jgi:hypothetical protein